MIRFTGGLPVLVHSRRSPPEDNASQSSGHLALDNDGDDDRGTLWDLRVKVTLHEGGSSPRQSGANGDGSSEQRRDFRGVARAEAGGSESALV